MKRRLLAIFMAMTLVVGAMPVNARESYTDVELIQEGELINDELLSEESEEIEYVEEADIAPLAEGDSLNYYDIFTYKVNNDEIYVERAIKDSHFKVDGVLDYEDYCQLDSVTIPSQIDGYPVTHISSSAFKDCDHLMKVEFPDSIVSIGRDAFLNCKKLTYVKLPAQLEQIGKGAFRNTGISQIKIPKTLQRVDYEYYLGEWDVFGGTPLKDVEFEVGVTLIPDALFENCTNLTDIELPDTLERIGEQSFGKCTGLTRIDIPDTVTYLGRRAFIGCTNLKDVHLSKNLEEIGRYAFNNCSSLKSIKIPKSLKSVDYEYYQGDGNIFEGSALENVEFEEGVTSLPDCLFKNCTNLKEIELPDTLERFGEQTFANCNELLKVVFSGDAPTIMDNVFEGCDLAAYYPKYNVTWTDDKFQNYGGKVKWIPYADGIYAPPKTITEDMLFTTEYYTYLKNSSYENMIMKISKDETDILADPAWNNMDIACRTVLSDGFLGQLKRITDDLVYGNDYTANQVREKMARDYILKLGGNKALYSDVMNAFSSSLKKSNKVLGIIEKGAGADKKALETFNKKDFEIIAKALKDGVKFGDYDKFSGNCAPLSEELIKLAKNDKLLEQVSDVFKASGKIVTTMEVIITVATIKMMQIEVVDQYIEMIPEYSGLHTGLVMCRDKLRRTDLGVFLEEFQKKEFATDAIEFLITALLRDSAEDFLSWTGGLSLVEKCFGFLMKLNHTLDIDEWMTAFFCEGDQLVIRNAVEGKYLEIAKNVKGIEPKDSQKLKEEYIALYNLYIISILQSEEYLKNYSSNKKAYTKLKKHINSYKYLLTYENYISSCVKNANRAYVYEELDTGSVVIKDIMDVLDTTLSGKEKMVANNYATFMSAEEDLTSTNYNCVDIPSEINGMPVSAVAESFMANSDTAILSIPNSVTKIGKQAFKDCDNLIRVFMENGLEEIEEEAFMGCSSMKELDIPDTVQTLGNNLLSNDTEVKIIGSKDSIANAYADSNGISFEQREKAVSEISVHKKPEKLSYKMSEKIDLSGLELEVTYVDGTSKIINTGYDGAFKEKKIGKSNILIGYGDCYTSLDVTVEADVCSYACYLTDEYGDQIHEEIKGEALAGTEVVLNYPSIEGYELLEEPESTEIGEYNIFYAVYRAVPKISIEDADVSYNQNVLYTGEPVVSLNQVSINGKTLKENIDYEVSYFNNVNVGTASFWIFGIGDYDGTLLCDFNIYEENTETDPDDEPTHVHNRGTEITENKIEATCTEAGSYESVIYCTSCGEEMERKKVTVPALGHNYENGKCTRCGATDPDYVEQHTHEKGIAVTENKVEATCTKAGSYESVIYCTSCGEEMERKKVTVPALGHNYENGKCTRCGAEDPDYKEEPEVEKILVNSIKITGLSNSIAAGDKIQLTATVLPTDATDKAVTWKSSNNKVATVNSKGLVSVNKNAAGKSVTITATAKDGSGVKGTYKINVKRNLVTKITLLGLKSVKAGKSIKLVAIVIAGYGANKKLKWTSSNKKYATVSSSGKVTAKKAGKGKKVKITASATDGSGKKATVTIKIK